MYKICSGLVNLVWIWISSDLLLEAQCTPVSKLMIVMYPSLDVSGNNPLVKVVVQNFYDVFLVYIF